jgi:hypothetical protein
VTNQKPPESKGISNDILKAAWGAGPPSPAALGQPEEPPADPATPPDFGGGERSKRSDEPLGMDDLLKAAARGFVERQ